jgi:hypothetical protein
MKNTYTNLQIYELAIALQNQFNDGSLVLPIKINFYLQKNKNNLYNLATEIENARMEILKKYGTLGENNEYEFTTENSKIASAELEDLYGLEQEVEVYMVDIDAFGDNLELTQRQMTTIMFMIN